MNKAKSTPSSGYRNDDLVEISDYLPKRFALKYDPPTISKMLLTLVLEYMVRSTGKLHHHKMKILRLTAESSTDETYDYLLSRHPLYIDSKKVAKK